MQRRFVTALWLTLKCLTRVNCFWGNPQNISIHFRVQDFKFEQKGCESMNLVKLFYKKNILGKVPQLWSVAEMDIVPFGAYNRHYSWFPGSLNTKEQSGRCIRASAILSCWFVCYCKTGFFFFAKRPVA